MRERKKKMASSLPHSKNPLIIIFLLFFISIEMQPILIGNCEKLISNLSYNQSFPIEFHLTQNINCSGYTLNRTNNGNFFFQGTFGI